MDRRTLQHNTLTAQCLLFQGQGLLDNATPHKNERCSDYCLQLRGPHDHAVLFIFPNAATIALHHVRPRMFAYAELCWQTQHHEHEHTTWIQVPRRCFQVVKVLRVVRKASLCVCVCVSCSCLEVLRKQGLCTVQHLKVYFEPKWLEGELCSPKWAGVECLCTILGTQGTQTMLPRRPAGGSVIGVTKPKLYVSNVDMPFLVPLCGSQISNLW